MVFFWAALSEIPQMSADSFMSLSKFDCSPNTGRVLELSFTDWASGERNNRPETDNWSHQNTPGGGNPRLPSNTLACNDTRLSHRSSVSQSHCETNPSWRDIIYELRATRMSPGEAIWALWSVVFRRILKHVGHCWNQWDYCYHLVVKS